MIKGSLDEIIWVVSKYKIYSTKHAQRKKNTLYLETKMISTPKINLMQEKMWLTTCTSQLLRPGVLIFFGSGDPT